MQYSGVLRKCRKCGEASPDHFKLRPDGTLSRWCRGCQFDAARSCKQGRIRVVSFATAGPYEQEAKGLMESAEDFGVTINLSVIAKTTWLEAVAFKPSFMRMQFDRFPDADGFLWVDADARFDAAPDFTTFDGAHLSYHRFKWSRTHPVEHLTGTIYIANTPTMRDFCEDWAAQTKHYMTTDTPEQHGLKWAVEHAGPEIVYRDCTPKWVWVDGDDGMVRVYPDERDPYLCHFQASRRLKT